MALNAMRSMAMLCLTFVGCNAIERPDPVLTDNQGHELEQRFMNYKFADSYADRQSLQKVVRDFRVPGAGLSVIGKLTNSRSDSFCVYEISLPGRDRDLVIIFQYDKPPSEGYRFVHRFIADTFVEDELLRPRREVTLDDGVLRYSSDGREYKREKLPDDKPMD